ncbi:MAG: Glu/Leu/Phe/Val dehydrogenase dimerization domain-containing protein [Acidobacteriota bacterium]
MDNEVLSLIEAWDGEAIVTRFDRPTGTWIFIALHDSTLGPMAGGTRIKVYPALADGLRDAMRLAEGMTDKWAGLGLGFGGGKAVLALAEPLAGERRRGLLQRYGAMIQSLRGAFVTGADLGTSTEDMATIAGACQHVLGIDYDDMTSTDPGPFTAFGVLCGLKAAVAHAYGSGDLAGRRILVQGLGGVGDPLARSLARDGASLLLSDLDAQRATDLAAELDAAGLDAEVIDSESVYSASCDVYAPCAIGATINAQTIPQLACRVVAGSANNQLLEPEDAERLHRKGVLYAPDYIINAGGAMAFSLMKDGERAEETLMRQVATIGDAVGEILGEASASEVSPLAAAKQRVRRILRDGLAR